MLKILFLKGLPASGKSTFAKELVSTDPNWVRVNKDDIRFMLHDRKWSRAREKVGEATQLAIAEAALATGKNVVVDNTHMSPRHENVWKEMAKKYGAEFTTKEFDTPIEKCLERDQKRGIPVGAVGKDVIMRMFYQYGCETYEHTEGLPPAYIVDIDGTLALMKDRGPFDWDKVGSDELNEALFPIIEALAERGAHIILLSGRDGVCREETIKWLQLHDVDYDHLYMREAGNTEPDTKIKKELYEAHVKGKYNVYGVFDDRPCMVRMWRKMGFFCFDCGNGIEF